MFMHAELRIEAGDLSRVMNAVRKVVVQSKAESRNLPRRAAQEAVALLRENIYRQTYAGRYKPWTSRYRDWKAKRGAPMMYWNLSGDLIRNLRSIRFGSRDFVAGIQANILDSGNKSYGKKGKRKAIAMYAHVMEYGGNFGKKGGRHPKRPLFKPTMQEYWRDFLPRQGMLSLKAIGDKWR